MTPGGKKQEQAALSSFASQLTAKLNEKRATFLQQEGFLPFQTLIFLMNTDVRSSNQGFARKSQPIVKPYPMYDELYNLPLRDSCQGYEVLLMPSDAHWCCLRRCVGCKERTLINYQDI